MITALEWFVPPAALDLAWFGPDAIAVSSAAARSQLTTLATIIGPRGPAGSGTARFDVGSASTWIIPHGLGRTPAVQVFLATGEQVIADVVADAVNVTVTFPNPQTGFVLAN